VTGDSWHEPGQLSLIFDQTCVSQEAPAFLPWEMKCDIFIIIPMHSPAAFIEQFAKMMSYTGEPDLKVLKNPCNFFLTSLQNNFYFSFFLFQMTWNCRS